MTLNSYPDPFTSVNDSLIWIFYDANAVDVTKLNYKYVGECWIDGVKVATERAYPHPGSDIGLFDFTTTIRGYIEPVFEPTTNVIIQSTLAAGQFITHDVVIKIREEYNGSVGSVVFTDSARNFYNNYLERNNIDGRQNIGHYNDKPITTRGRVIELTLETPMYLIPYYIYAGTTFDLVVDGTNTYTMPLSGVSAIMLNIAPAAINAEFPGLIDDTTESYTVAINGEAFTVKMVCKGFYTNYVLHFLNKFGAFESMLFNKVRRRSVDIEKRDYQQLPYRIDGSGVLTYKNGNLYHEQRTTYAVKTSERLNVQTDFVSDVDYVWLAQLNASPMVYLDDEGWLHPVKISNSNYAYRENIVDRLTTLQLDIEFAAPGNTQYR